VTLLPTAEWLLGSWQLLRHDAALEFTARTRMQFAADARLTYTIPTPQGNAVVVLRWALDGARLTTTHEDGAHEVSVAVRRGEADILEFDFGGPRAWFVRATP
jgi:hypothetical protein